MYHRLIAVSMSSILILACGFALCAPVKTEPPKPIPSGPECYTQAKFDEALAKVHYRTIVDSYRKVGAHDPKWDDKAVSFLEGYAKSIGKPLDPSYVDQALKNGEELITLGCTDAMVFYPYAMACKSKGDFKSAETYFRKALEGFRNGQYPKCQTRLAPYELFKVGKVNQSITWEEINSLPELCRTWNIEAFADGSYLPGEQRIAYELAFKVLDEFPYKNRMDFYEALKKQPGVDTYVANLIGGWYCIEEGWRLRGPGYAYAVPQENWKAMEEKLRVAYKLLAEAWRLHPEFPEAPGFLIKVAMAGYAAPGETTRLWFDRSVAAQMDYQPAYSLYTTALLPRWGGSHEELYDLGAECVKTGRFDTRVPWQFIDEIGAIITDMNGDWSYWRKPETTELIRQMCDGYKKGGWGGGQDRWDTIKALLLYNGGQCVDAKRILDALGDRADKAASEDILGTKFEDIRDKLEVLGTEPGSALTEAMVLYGDGKLREARAIAEDVLAKSGNNKKTADYTRQWLARLGPAESLAQGEWTGLGPDADFANWSRDYGDWTVEKDGGVQCMPQSMRCPSMTCGAELGNRLELKGEIEFSGPKELGASAVVYLEGDIQIVAVSFPRNKSQVAVRWITSDWSTASTVPEIGDHSSFVIRYWDGMVSVEMNGKPLPGNPFVCKKDADKGIHHPPDSKRALKLTACASKPGCTVKFNNLQVRKLTEMPADIAKKLQAK